MSYRLIIHRDLYIYPVLKFLYYRISQCFMYNMFIYYNILRNVKNNYSGTSLSSLKCSKDQNRNGQCSVLRNTTLKSLSSYRERDFI